MGSSCKGLIYFVSCLTKFIVTFSKNRMKPLNIVVIAQFAGSPKYGMQLGQYYLALEWVRMGHSVTIVSASFAHMRFRQPLVDGMSGYIKENIDGIRYIWVRIPPYDSSSQYHRAKSLFLFSMRAWSKNLPIKKADIVISSTPSPFSIYSAVRLSKRLGAKLVYEVRDLWPLTLTELSSVSKRHPFIMLMQWTENYAYKKADYVVSVLSKAKNHMVQHGLLSEKFIFIPNGITVENDQEILPDSYQKRLEALKSNDFFIIGYAGKLGLSNAVHTLIDALQFCDDVCLVILGSGEMLPVLKQKVIDLRLENNVFFFDPIPKKQVACFLSYIDVAYLGWLASPLYEHGMSSTKLNDYMLAAKPIICASDVSDYVIEESGAVIVCPAENPVDLYKKIVWMKSVSSSQRAKMGKKGQDWVVENLSYPKLAMDFLNAVAPINKFMSKYGYTSEEFDLLEPEEKIFVSLDVAPEEITSYKRMLLLFLRKKRKELFGLLDGKSNVLGYKRELLPWVREKLEDHDSSFDYRYWYHGADKFLEKPEIVVSDTDTDYPVITLGNIKPDLSDNLFINSYFEFDTSPNFNSPNLWRYPQLQPYFENGYLWNRVSPLGSVLDIHQPSHNKFDMLEHSVRFPFRVSAMALPLKYSTLSFDDLEKKSLLLTHGLKGFDAIREVYSNLRQSLLWGGDTLKKFPFDIFVSSTGGCGHINNLLGFMLEVSGYRYRIVGGFNPFLRSVISGSGHSAIEVFNVETKLWSFIDSFLDIMLVNISASQLSVVREGELEVITLDPIEYPMLDSSYNLAQLFRYRTYTDMLHRLPAAPMSRLAGDETSYGLDWELIKPHVGLSIDNDIPELLTVYVRARYAHSDCPIQYLNQKDSCSSHKVTMSKWAESSFQVSPRNLLSQKLNQG